MARRNGSGGTTPGNDGPENDAVGFDSNSLIVDDGNVAQLSPAGLIIVDPAEFGGDTTGGSERDAGNSAGEPRKRRGRKPGTGSTRSQKQAPLDINGIEKILYSGHSILAAITKTPEFQLANQEAEEIAKAIGNVSRHYDVSASAKTVDIANLIMVLGMVYGSRLLAIRARKTNERKKQSQQNAADGVVTFPFTPRPA